MIWMKSLAAGLVAGLLACMLSMALLAAGVYVWVVRRSESSGQGGIGAVSVGGDALVLFVLLVFAVAFIAGFRWEFRRASAGSARGAGS